MTSGLPLNRTHRLHEIQAADKPRHACKTGLSNGVAVRQTATPIPHGSGQVAGIQTHARRKATRNETQAWVGKTAATAALFIVLFLGPLFGAKAFAKCHTHKCWARVSEKRHQHFWVKRFHRFPAGWQQWAHATSWCEANHRAHTNTGNGFYGAFQYTLQTAWVAGFHRRPDLTTWHEQAVRSIRYAQRHGTGAWPVCG